MKPQMKSKTIQNISLLLIAILAMSVTACSQRQQVQADSTTDSEVPKSPLAFRITWTDYSDRGVAIKKIVEMYNAKSTGSYEIILQGGDENIENINNLMAVENEAPILVLPYRYVKYLGSESKLLDLSEAFQKEKDYFYPELWKLGTVADKTYGIPWVGHSICLIYNKELLETAGVDPSSIKSLETFEDALEKVEATTAAKGVGLVGANHNDVSWMVNQFIYGFGGSLVDSTGKKVAINTKASKEALDYYINHLGKYAQPTWQDDTGVQVMKSFRSQEIAFEFQGVWGVTDIEKNGNPFEIGIINLEDIGLKSEVGPMMLSVPQNMDINKQEEAIKFIEFMISIEAQEKIMDGEYSPEHDAYYPFRVPTRMDMTDQLVFKKYPQYLPFVKGFKDPSIDVPVAKWQIVKEQIYAPNLNRLVKGEISIEDFLNLVESQGNIILNEK